MDHKKHILIAAPVIGFAAGILMFGDVGLGIVLAAFAFGGALCLVPTTES